MKDIRIENLQNDIAHLNEMLADTKNKESEEQNEGKSNNQTIAEMSNWKLMYEELEKTTLENVNKANEYEHANNELKQECERLSHNLHLREEQLAKQSMQIS